MIMRNRFQSSPRNTSPANTSPQRKQGFSVHAFPSAPARFRSGLSIIEVLTAIVVALIGLAGVLVMIPFAVNQAQVGMDTEKAVHLARNASAELEIRGTLESSAPVTFPNPPAWPAATPNPDLRNATARCYCLDPMGVVARVTATVPNDSGTFPFVHPDLVNEIFNRNVAQMAATQVGEGFDQRVLVQRVSIHDLTSSPVAGIPLRLSLARSGFTWGDDLQTRAVTDQEFADPTLNVPGLTQYPSKDLVLPIQNFDQTVTSTGIVLNGRRQNLGEMSWIVLACPATVTPRLRSGVTDAGGGTPGYVNAVATPPVNQLIGADDVITEMRNFYIAFKRRPMPVYSGDPLAPQPYDRVYQVEWPGSELNDNSFRNSYNGGLLKLRETRPATLPAQPLIPNQVAQSNGLSSQRADIRRGDWIGLTNVRYEYFLQRFVQSWNFYRVTDATVANDRFGDYWAVTLEGPEWDFQRPMVFESMPTPPLPQWHDPTYDGTTTPPTWTTPGFRFGAVQITGSGPDYEYFPTSTMAVHLPDVWTVFERTTRLGSN